MKNIASIAAALVLLFQNADAHSHHGHQSMFSQMQNSNSHSQMGHFFAELKKNFAEEGQTDEEAYLEIAKKLMAMSDKLDELKQCMDKLSPDGNSQGSNQEGNKGSQASNGLNNANKPAQ